MHTSALSEGTANSLLGSKLLLAPYAGVVERLGYVYLSFQNALDANVGKGEQEYPQLNFQFDSSID